MDVSESSTFSSFVSGQLREVSLVFFSSVGRESGARIIQYLRGQLCVCVYCTSVGNVSVEVCDRCAGEV